jgi:hypothetical protein
MAIACFRLFTAPPFPPFPDRKVPRFLRRMALSTVLLADLPYLAIFSSNLHKSTFPSDTLAFRISASDRRLSVDFPINICTANDSFPRLCIATNRAPVFLYILLSPDIPGTLYVQVFPGAL